MSTSQGGHNPRTITADQVLHPSELRALSQDIAKAFGTQTGPDIRTLAKYLRGDEPVSDSGVAVVRYLQANGYIYDVAAPRAVQELLKRRRREWRFRLARRVSR